MVINPTYLAQRTRQCEYPPLMRDRIGPLTFLRQPSTGLTLSDEF